MTTVKEHNALINAAIYYVGRQTKWRIDFKQIARWVGINQTELHQLIRNRKAWSIPAVLRLCKGLGCTVEALLTRGEEERDPEVAGDTRLI